VDAITDIFKSMADGDANATVLLSPNMGVQAYDAIKRYLAGETLPALIPVPSAMYFQDTAAEEYAARSGS
jgi:simple sugar transport system substrate-binding protein